MLVGDAEDGDVAVDAGEVVVRRRAADHVAVAAAAHLALQLVERRQIAEQGGDGGVEHRHLDALAAAAALALAQREQDAAEQMRRTEHVDEGRAALHRRLVGIAGDRHRARPAPGW